MFMNNVQNNHVVILAMPIAEASIYLPILFQGLFQHISSEILAWVYIQISKMQFKFNAQTSKWPKAI